MDGEQCRDWVDWLASDVLALSFSLDDYKYIYYLR